MLRQSGFPASVMSQNRHELSRFNVQVYIVDSALRILHVAVFVVLEIVKSQLECFDNSHVFVLCYSAGASSVTASPVSSSISAQISSRPCFVSDENGMRIPSLRSFSPSLIAFMFF